MEKERFILQSSKELGFWVATDTDNNIVIKFREHQFNETQQVTLLDGNTFNSVEEATRIATYLREMADWLRHEHYNIVMPSLLDKRAAMGQRIRDLRIERGLSQTQLAAMAGITTGNLCRIEAGKYSTGLDLLNRIADALGMELNIR